MAAEPETTSTAGAEPCRPEERIARLDAFNYLSLSERYARGLTALARVPHEALGLADRSVA
jgi:hypothetical protein